MNRIKINLTGIVVMLLLFSTHAIADECHIPGGKTWSNELGSEMQLAINSSGIISGRYKTALGCGKDKWRDLSGVCNGYAVTFSVNWQECDAITAWSGTYENGKLTTFWHMVSAKTPKWDSIISGTDTFIQK